MALLETHSAHWLLQQPLTKPSWIVERLITTGLHLLVGSPKVGKSWLVLMLGLCVSQGVPFWDFVTQKSGVLYLCLEDTYSRIQQRLWKLTEEAEESFDFAIAADKITSGLIPQLEGYIRGNPDTKLVIIDTFQVIRQPSRDSAYAADYSDLTMLKRFADENDLAVLLIHHTRKMGDSDIFNTVSGTNGITGSADSTLVLSKASRCDGNATLTITGRDVEHQELKVRFRDCRWEMVGEASRDELEERDVPDDVLRALDHMACKPGDWQGTATDLLREAGIEGVSVAVFGKHLAQYSSFMAERGIGYERRHSREGNILVLSHLPTREGGEGSEG